MTFFQLKSLRHKFLLGAATGLASLSLALLGLAAALYQYQLGQERSQASQEVNRLLEAALENAMLKRDIPGLHDIIHRIGAQEGVRGAMILAPDGEVRFSSDPAILHTRFPLADYGLCLDCPERRPGKGLTSHFTLDHKGNEVMRSVNPVANKPICHECHGDLDQQAYNGVLIVDYDAAPIRRQAAISAASLAIMGGLLLLATLMGGAGFIYRYVLRPVSKLSAASQGLAQGRLDSRAELPGQDELAELGHSFDHMADNLQTLVRQIREQEAFLQSLVDAIPDGIRVIDAETMRIVLHNRAYADQLALTGAMDHRGLTCHASAFGRATPCPPSMMFCPVHEIAQHGHPCKSLMEYQALDGKKCQVEVFAAPMQAQTQGVNRRYVVESSRDMAKALKFSQEQKLAEMARLATGVAHEIHNPLASIRIALHATQRAAQQANQEAGQSGPGQNTGVILEYLEIVDGEIDRCLRVTESLLKLGMAPSATPQLVEVNPAVAETLALLAWEAEAAGVVIQQALAQPSPRALATDSELRAVVLNLAQNALHAMPQGGRLVVTTRTDGHWVELAFEDSGVGIAPEHAKQVFDPFFSHRADGKTGTGLGLSICRSILEAYGGRIDFASQPGTGSRFVVHLPDAASRITG